MSSSYTDTTAVNWYCGADLGYFAALPPGARLQRELAAYRGELDRVGALLAAADGDGLLRLFERARVARDGWLARQSGGDEV